MTLIYVINIKENLFNKIKQRNVSWQQKKV